MSRALAPRADRSPADLTGADRLARALAVLGVALALAIGALAGVVSGATPAQAHASLLGGTVFDGDVVDVAPEELVLEFNEPVTTPRGGLRVHAGDGERVDVGGTFSPDPERVGVELQPDLADGTYAVTYRVTSADGHPIAGAYVFSVGEQTGDADALLTQVFAGDADRPWAVAATTARFAMYVATLLAAGVALTVAWLRATPLQAAPTAGRMVRLGAVVGIGATVLGVLLQNVLVTGDGLAALVDGPGLAAVLTSFVGISAVVRIVGLAGLWLAARQGAPAVALGSAGAVVALGSLLLEGHTLTTGPAAVVWGGSVVHILAGAVWLGGLALMGAELRARRRADDPVAAGRLVARFSSLFTLSVIAVVAAGSALTWAEVRAPRALTSTTYGWTLVAKFVAVLPLLAIGLYNNQRLVPLLSGRGGRRGRGAAQPVIAGGSGDTVPAEAALGGPEVPASQPAGGSADGLAERAARRDQAWAHLRTVVRVEVALMGVVLAITSVLVALQPAAEAAGITGAYSANQPFEGIGQMTFTVDPNRAGRNEVHLYLLTDTGRPFTEAEPDAVTMTLTQTELDIGPIEVTPAFAGPGHWTLTGSQLAVAGPWEITTIVELNRFDVVQTTTEVVVNP